MCVDFDCYMLIAALGGLCLVKCYMCMYCTHKWMDPYLVTYKVASIP